VNIKSDITFLLNVGFEVCHLEVIVHPVYYKVREPWVFSTSLKQFIEELQALLTKIVAEYFETHQSLVLAQGLSEQS
jgi:hypothetical protein